MNGTLHDNRVAIIRTIDHYGLEVPFHPAAAYPEFSATRNKRICGFNPVHESVRNLFLSLGLDKDRVGGARWNPLSGLIAPGNKVFIKPNLVRENKGLGRDVNSLVTHASVVRPIVDYVVIQVPNLKTHSKAGVTLSLKNLVGIVTNKACVPHLRNGSPSQGGDERADRGWRQKIAGAAMQSLHDGIRSVCYLGSSLAKDRTGFTRRIESRYRWVTPPKGSWEGNDTIWRVALDLNRIMLFADKAGVLGSALRRKVFQIVDGIIGAEKNGPLDGLEKPSGVLVGGHNPYAVDLAATRLMGFDPGRIPLLENAGRQDWLFDGSPVAVVSNIPEWNISDLLRDVQARSDLGFLPPDSWHLRRTEPARTGRAPRRE